MKKSLIGKRCRCFSPKCVSVIGHERCNCSGVVWKDMVSSPIEIVQSDELTVPFSAVVTAYLLSMEDLPHSMIEHTIEFNVKFLEGHSSQVLLLKSLVRLIVSDTKGVYDDDLLSDKAIRMIANEYKEVVERMYVEMEKHLYNSFGYHLGKDKRVSMKEAFEQSRNLMAEYLDHE